MKKTLSSKDKFIVNEWHPTKNGDKKPEDFSTGSTYIAWWVCPVCKQEYQRSINHKVRGDRCPVCSGRKVVPGINDLLSQRPDLAAEWDYKLNSKKPDEVYYKSNERVFWKCSKGHSWSIRPKNRVNGSGCPVCSNRVVLTGFNDLTTVCPEIAAEWNYVKNGELTPDKIVFGSNKLVWWKCKTCGKEWKTGITNRVVGKIGCPNCAVKRGAEKNSINASVINSLVEKFPDIAKEFHPTKNGSIKINNLSCSSNKKIWWHCSKCGQDWIATPNTRSSGSGCPVCANQVTVKGINDLQTLFPQIAAEWNYERNKDITPSDVVSGSNKSYWWKCSDCGYEWKASVNHRTKGRGCKYCGAIKSVKTRSKNAAIKNNFAEHYPDLVKEWNYERNQDLKPEQFSCFSNKKVWWKCSFCGNEWSASINDRASGRGCNNCSLVGTSFLEQAIYYYVKHYYNDAINRYKDMGYEFDVYIPSLRTAIEFDGAFYHNNISSLTKDNIKDKFCHENGIKLIRIRDISLPETDYAINISFNNNLDYCIQEILMNLEIKNIPNIDSAKNKILILSSFRRDEEKESVGNLYPELLNEWDYEKNGTLSPYSLKYASNIKVWWKCKFGHEWQTAISERTRKDKTGCPFCNGKKVLKGFNDLASQFPDVAAEWHPTLNGGLSPEDIHKGSAKKVWWLCNKCGNEWQASPNTRTVQGCGCAVCKGRKVKKGFNDLSTTNPELLKEWNYDKNKDITPYNISKGSHKMVWWKCKNGHEWQSLIHNRISGNGCPQCYKERRSKKGKNDE